LALIFDFVQTSKRLAADCPRVPPKQVTKRQLPGEVKTE